MDFDSSKRAGRKVDRINIAKVSFVNTNIQLCF